MKENNFDGMMVCPDKEIYVLFKATTQQEKTFNELIEKLDKSKYFTLYTAPVIKSKFNIYHSVSVGTITEVIGKSYKKTMERHFHMVYTDEFKAGLEFCRILDDFFNEFIRKNRKRKPYDNHISIKVLINNPHTEQKPESVYVFNSDFILGIPEVETETESVTEKDTPISK